jgi:nucleotide-binding universal stress UspA family protein
MSFKSIIVHLAEDPRNAARLDAARALANGAHLVGLYTIVPMPIPAYGIAEIPPQIFDDYEQNAAAKAKEARDQFESSMRRDGISAEWREERGFPLDILREHSLYADLTIVGQPMPSGPEHVAGTEGLPGDLAIASGRPVLAIPHSGRFTKVGETVMVAWNGSREAARAIADAMPMLERAKRVYVVAANVRTSVPALDVATHLARHGIKVETKAVHAEDTSVATTLLNQAAEVGADLIVMGAYGHSRFNEFVFGGVTRHLLGHMTVPTMFSH